MEVERVGFLPRFIAYVIDSIIMSVPSILINYLILKPALGLDMMARQAAMGRSTLDPSTLSIAPERALLMLVVAVALLLVWGIGYPVCFWSAGGQTPGKMVLGLRVISTDGEIISMPRAFLRLIGYVVSSLIFYLGFLWIIWDKDKQGWHDKIAGTYVVRTRSPQEL